jgi:DNA-binding Lrp family transcriptional regulator
MGCCQKHYKSRGTINRAFITDRAILGLSGGLSDLGIHAVILVKVNPGLLKRVVAEVEKIGFLKRFATITGEYDILIEVEADDVSQLHDLIVNELDLIKGIEETNTHIILKDLRSG